MKKVIAVTLVLVTMLCAFTGCGPNQNAEKVDAKIILILEDKKEISYDVNVSGGASVRDALFEADLIDEEAQTAFFVETIDGHSAKAEDGVLWSVCDEKGEPLGSIDDVTISAGQTIKIIYTVAPSFDD